MAKRKPKPAPPPVLRAVLDTRVMRWGRFAALVVGGLLMIFGAIAALVASGSPSETAVTAVLVGSTLGYVLLLAVGVPFWAMYRARFEVSEAGVREEVPGPAGPRVRAVGWSEMRDYVLTDTGNGARLLTIHPREGRPLSIGQGPKEVDRAAFSVFQAAFLAGVRVHRLASGAEAIREKPSFLDGPVARVLAGGAVATVAVLAVLTLASGRAGMGEWGRLLMIAGLLLPLAVRVFAGSRGGGPSGDGGHARGG